MMSIDEITYPYYSLTIFFAFFIGFGSLVYDSLKRTEQKTIFIIVISAFIGTVSILYGWRHISLIHGGIDASAYNNIFNSIDTNSTDGIFEQRIEKGFATLMWLTKSLGLPIFAFNFLFCFVLISLIFLTATQLPFTFFRLVSVVLFSLLFIDSFNISRMIISIFILFFVCKYLSLGKYKTSILITIIASSFQMVAAWGGVFILYHYLKEKNINKLGFFLLYLLATFIAFLSVKLFMVMLTSIGYGYYVVDESSYSLLNYVFCLYLFSVYYFFLKRDKDYNQSKLSHTVFGLLPTMVFTLPLYIAVPIAYRFNYIYILFFYFTISEILKWSWIQLKRKNVMMFTLSFFPIVLYSVIKFYTYFERDIYAAQIWILDRNINLW